jgi:ankyrin repeat protein
MVTLLLKHKSPLNATDSAGYTPLHHAAAEGHGGLLSLGLNEQSDSRSIGDTAVALLKEGAETDKKDADGCLALDLTPDREVSTLGRSNLSLNSHQSPDRFDASSSGPPRPRVSSSRAASM